MRVLQIFVLVTCFGLLFAGSAVAAADEGAAPPAAAQKAAGRHACGS